MIVQYDLDSDTFFFNSKTAVVPDLVMIECKLKPTIEHMRNMAMRDEPILMKRSVIKNVPKYINYIQEVYKKMTNASSDFKSRTDVTI